MVVHGTDIRKSVLLKDLSESIRIAEGRGGRGTARDGLETGWEGMPLLERGAIHEWVGLAAAGEALPQRTRRAGDDWTPPCGVLIHLAQRAMGGGGGRRGVAVWVGRRLHPYAVAAGGVDGWLLVDPPDAASRLWAIDLALRSPGVAAVVADASGLDMAASRRLQLAAEAGSRAGGGGIGLLARPAWEAGRISAAATRWLVRPAPSEGRLPRWSIQLLRARGALAAGGAFEPIVVEWSRASCRVVVPAAVVHGPGPAPAAPGLALRTA